jgi:hypothetical protein
MAQKLYHKGLAQKCFDIERYITRYNLDTVSSITAEWTSARQQAALAIKNAAALIDDLPFRQQP